jgi:hypothetical protein
VRGLRTSVLALLLVASAVVVVASPAFATPRLTVSTGTAARPDNSAVSPFITPIGNSETSGLTITNRYTSRRGSSFKARSAARTDVNVTCSELRASGFVGLTHTQLRVSSIAFTMCKIDQGTITATVTAIGVDSATPILLHLTRDAGGGSWDGTFNISRGQTFTIVSTIGLACRLTVREGQSVPIEDTDTNNTIEANSARVIYKSEAGSNPSGCPVPQASDAFQETTTPARYTHDTPTTEGVFRSTLTSNAAHAERG